MWRVKMNLTLYCSSSASDLSKSQDYNEPEQLLSFQINLVGKWSENEWRSKQSWLTIIGSSKKIELIRVQVFMLTLNYPFTLWISSTTATDSNFEGSIFYDWRGYDTQNVRHSCSLHTQCELRCDITDGTEHFMNKHLSSAQADFCLFVMFERVDSLWPQISLSSRSSLPFTWKMKKLHRRSHKLIIWGRSTLNKEVSFQMSPGIRHDRFMSSSIFIFSLSTFFCSTSSN